MLIMLARMVGAKKGGSDSALFLFLSVFPSFLSRPGPGYLTRGLGTPETLIQQMAS